MSQLALRASWLTIRLGSRKWRLVVVVLVPIAFRVPAVLMFIPPLMPLTPAPLPRIMQFSTLVICPLAVASVFLDCFVEFMFRVYNSPLTPVAVFRLNSGRSRKEQNRCEKG